MSRLRSRLARTAVGVSIAVGALVGIAVANSSVADASASVSYPNNDHCVTRREFRRVTRGMTVSRVMSLLAWPSQFRPEVPHYGTNSYQWSRCSGGDDYVVYFDDDTWRSTGKGIVWW